MGLRMYRGSSPTPTAARKPDPTAAARSPIRRAPSRPLSTREQRRQSTNAESLFLSSQSSPQLAPRDGSVEPYSVSGNYSVVLSPVDMAAPEPPAETRPLRDREQAETMPFVHHTSTIAHNSEAISSRESTRATSNPATESTRRMQVTRQRPTRRASLEADMGRFVVRPILSEDEAGADTAESPTVDPMELLVVSGPVAQAPATRQRRFGSAQNLGRVRRRDRVRSRSPQRRSAAPRIAPPGPTDGLGDRRRSPSVEVEESDWETLRVTIQPDAQLPSASSSFTSASATSSSSDAQTASGPSSATTSAASSSFITNHRYVLPTAECLDITTAQRECGVVCDDARDAQPPFPTSRGPSRHATREPSADRPRTRRRGSLPARTDSLAGGAPGRSPHPLAFASAARSETGEDDANASDAGSTAPAHLRLPTPTEPTVFDFDALLRAQSSDHPWTDSPPPAPESIDSPPHIPGEANDGHPPQTRLGQRLAEVQLQWHQLRRINELLRCGREVPGWLWEVAGLAPELQVREFEI